MTIKTMTMPQLGESVTEGTVSQWLINIGDSIDKYQPLLEVMTDKVNAEVPSLFSGEIVEMLVEEDETVSVGTPICKISVEGAQAIEDNQTTEQNDKTTMTPEQGESQSMKKRYSPAVLTLAQEHGIDLNTVEGT